MPMLFSSLLILNIYLIILVMVKKKLISDNNKTDTVNSINSLGIEEKLITTAKVKIKSDIEAPNIPKVSLKNSFSK